MTPEDCYWLVTHMAEEFPGLITGEPVDPRRLVEWVSYRVSRDPLLESVARGSSYRGDDKDLADTKWSCPVCATPYVPDVFNDGDVLKCYVCETTWRADPLKEEDE